MAKGVCKQCKKKKDINLSGKSEGLCNVCYRKLLWKPKLIKCKRCSRELPMHAKGLCRGCYSSVFQIDKVKASNMFKYHGIDYNTYKYATQACVLCGFDKIVEMHHLDHNKKNNSKTNLVGLCPNHHKMIHNIKFQKEVFSDLKSKGFAVPGKEGQEFFYKNR